MHCLAHIGATAASIKRNSNRLKAGGEGAGGPAEAPRDQGFTRPKARAPGPGLHRLACFPLLPCWHPCKRCLDAYVGIC